MFIYFKKALSKVKTAKKKKKKPKQNIPGGEKMWPINMKISLNPALSLAGLISLTCHLLDG